MDMFSLLAASLTLVSTTPDCRIGLASDLIVSPLSTPGHYHPESQVEPGTVTHFFTSGSPQWGFAPDGDDSAAGPASGEADLSRLHLRAMYLGCDVAAHRAELASLAQTLETLTTSEDWSRLGSAYIAILLYEIYAAIDADGGERERLAADLDTISYGPLNADYFRALTSASDAYNDALAAIEARDSEAYRDHLETLAESIARISSQRDDRRYPISRETENLLDGHNIGTYPPIFSRIAMMRLMTVRLQVLGPEETGGMPWHPGEIAILDDLLEGGLPEIIAGPVESFRAFGEWLDRDAGMTERNQGGASASTILRAINMKEQAWVPPYLYSPYLWAQYQLAEFEMISALHEFRYDPDLLEGAAPAVHQGTICAAEARYEAARDVLDGLFDLEPLAPSRCEPVVGDRALVGVE